MDTETLKTLYSEVFKPLIEVEAIFNKWFGEEKVDFQRPTELDFCRYWQNTNDVEAIKRHYAERSYPIIINFGTVTITNEQNQSEELPGMLAKVVVGMNGSLVGSFGLNRYIYTEKHLRYGYMHSHVHCIPNPPSEFQSSCLGSGPIRSTIATLNTRFNSDVWELFCVELQRYVETESLRGGPYHRLAQLGREHTTSLQFTHCIGNSLQSEGKTLITQFILYLFKNIDYGYKYVDGQYSLNISYPEFVKDVSKKFFRWWYPMHSAIPLAQLERRGIIMQGMVVGNQLKTSWNTQRNRFNDIIGQTVCKFKGETLRVQVISESRPDTTYYVLAPNYCDFILSCILNFINVVPIFLLFHHPNVAEFYEKQGNTESIRNRKNLFLL